MGLASEFLAGEYLRRRHPQEMNDECWVSTNRREFCGGSEGNDSLGYDFRVVTARNEWLYEVKSAQDAGGEFELTASEIKVAGSAMCEGRRRYRILYVPCVFDPTRWRVLPLQNPLARTPVTGSRSCAPVRCDITSIFDRSQRAERCSLSLTGFRKSSRAGQPMI
jgi:hypothetical protein